VFTYGESTACCRLPVPADLTDGSAICRAATAEYLAAYAGTVLCNPTLFLDADLTRDDARLPSSRG